MVMGLLGYLMYRGGRLVAGAFWLVVFGNAVKHRDWIERNAPWGYGVYTETLLLVGIVVFAYWMLLPKIRTWRYQRLTARAAATMAESQQHLITVKIVGNKAGRWFDRWRRKWHHHPSEYVMDVDGDEVRTSDVKDVGKFVAESFEETAARIAAEASGEVASYGKESTRRRRNKGRGNPKPSSKRARDESEEIRDKVRETLDEMKRDRFGSGRALDAAGRATDKEDNLVRQIVREEIERQRRGE